MPMRRINLEVYLSMVLGFMYTVVWVCLVGLLGLPITVKYKPMYLHNLLFS